jgi:hypothetical protein
VAAPTFDPAGFKSTTREQWQEAAESWDGWGPTLEDWLGPATLPSPLRMASAAECLRVEQESYGALHQMLAGLDEAGRQAAWQEIGEALAEFDGADGFLGPCELLVGAATRQ